LNADEASSCSAILSLLSDLLQAARESLNGMLSFRAESIPPPLPFNEEVLGILTAGLRKSATAVPALHGLKWIVTTKNLLTDTELGFVVHNVSELLLADSREFEDAR
jgi:DNA repair/transcription protein MET18/MMS19